MGGKTVEQTYKAGFDRTFEACRQAAAELGYSITAVSKESGTISFNTGRSMKTWGGQDLTANLFSSGSSTRVVVGGCLAKGGSALTGGGAQLGAWGEKKKLSMTLLEKIKTVLPGIPEGTTAAKPAAATSAADELLKLKSLLDAGALSQEEFDDAKRKLLA